MKNSKYKCKCPLCMKKLKGLKRLGFVSTWKYICTNKNCSIDTVEISRKELKKRVNE